MPRYAITGPIELTHEEEELVVSEVKAALVDATEFTSGAAHGVDTVGAFVAHDAGVGVRLTVPSAWHNEELVEAGKKLGWEIEYALSALDASTSYMIRNDLTISHADVLLTFPETSAERQRSGTWATVRRSRRAGIEARFFPLDGSDPWVEFRP